MNKFYLFITFFLFTILTLTSCKTTEQQTREAQRRQWEGKLSQQVLELEEKLLDLKSSLENLKRQQDILKMRIAGLETEYRNAGVQQKSQIASIRSEIKANRATIDKKMEIILEEVAKENERLLAKILEARGAGYLQGYEHVVKSGETLSEIARQYGVTVNAIVEANDLTDPHSLRVGQKLFIPQ